MFDQRTAWFPRNLIIDTLVVCLDLNNKPSAVQFWLLGCIRWFGRDISRLLVGTGIRVDLPENIPRRSDPNRVFPEGNFRLS